MNTSHKTPPDPVRVRPLLRAIVRELRERLPEVRRLEARMQALRANGSTANALSVRAELASERRALRSIEQELGDLGWSWEEDGADVRLVARVARGLECLSWEPGRTGFWPRTEMSRG